MQHRGMLYQISKFWNIIALTKQKIDCYPSKQSCLTENMKKQFLQLNKLIPVYLNSKWNKIAHYENWKKN